MFSYKYINEVYKRFGEIAKENGYSLDVMLAPRGMYTKKEARRKGEREKKWTRRERNRKIAQETRSEINFSLVFQNLR